MKKASSLRVLGALVVAGGIAWAALHRDAFDVGALQTRIEAMGGVAPVAFVAIYAIAAVLFVPGSALTLAAGALFGPIAGALYSLAGATIGATLAFLLARHLVGDWVRRRTGQRLGELVEGIEREGWRFVAFVRLVPLFPYNVLNYALGLTRIPLVPYVAATLVCMAPGAAAYSYVGYAGGAALGGGGEAVKAGLWALALLGLVALLPGFVRRHRGAASAATIGAQELERKLEAGEPVCVLDVRSPEEFHGPLGHIQGAVSIPVDQLPARLAEVDGWRSRLLVPVYGRRSALSGRRRSCGKPVLDVCGCLVEAWSGGGERVKVSDGPERSKSKRDTFQRNSKSVVGARLLSLRGRAVRGRATRFCVHCHCSMCRRNHGAAFVTWFGVPRTQFRLLAGESILTRYPSSDHGSRSFCSRCGTSLFCELDRDPETIDITLASVQAPIDHAPQAHVHFGTHVEWVEFLDQLPKVDTV